MNRLLLSLWLLGAALFGANTVIILGWLENKPKIDAGGADKAVTLPVTQPKEAQKAQGQQGASGNGESAKESTPENNEPAVRLEPNSGNSPAPQSSGTASANVPQNNQPNNGQNAIAGGNESAELPPMPPAPQGQQSSEPSTQQQPLAQQQEARPTQPSSPQPQPAPQAGQNAQQAEQSAPQAEQNAAQATPPATAQEAEQNAAQAGAPDAAKQQGEAEWVSSLGANVRSGPSSSAPRLGDAPAGAKMRVVSREKGWVQVADNDGKTGWVYEGLIAPSDVPESQKAAEAQAAPNQQQEPGERVKVAASGAAMRAGPSQSAATLFGLPYGRELRVLARQSGWVQVMDLGSKQTGWVEQSALAAAGEQQGQAADNSQQSENPQSQGAASNAPQRSSRDATLPPEHGNANGSPRQAWLPPEEVGPQHEMEEPRDRSRQWGKRHGRFGGFLRRAFGGL